jgi:hypothetical protein
VATLRSATLRRPKANYCDGFTALKFNCRILSNSVKCTAVDFSSVRTRSFVDKFITFLLFIKMLPYTKRCRHVSGAAKYYLESPYGAG